MAPDCRDYFGPVLRVYLDQNKWIDLARAATGHPLGARFVDALVAARAAVAAEEASFPLDLYRYQETGKRRDDRSRRALADLMCDLSRQHTMARSHDLLPAEIDWALKRRFGRPVDSRRHPVFGEGLTHMTGGHVRLTAFDASRLPDEIPFGSPEGLAELKRIYNGLVERELLRVGPDKMREVGFDPEDSSFAQRFVDFENSIGDAIREQGLSGGLLEVAVCASDLGGIQTAVTEALARIDITWNDFIDRSTPADLISFMDDLPTRYVTNVMRAAKLRQTQQRWEPNDFNDIVALPVAAVYCDVVVTEKQWVHRLRHGRVDRRYDTTLLSDTAQLVEILDHANRSPSRSTNGPKPTPPGVA